MCYDLKMNKQDLLKTSLWLVIAIFFLNSMAMKFHWYFTIWWFDMPMHFLGGVFIGLVSLAFLTNQEVGHPLGGPTSGKVILTAFLSVLMIGVLWELFEFSLDTFITYNPHNFLDTFSDLVFDLVGGLTASLYFLYNYKHEKNTNR